MPVVRASEPLYLKALIRAMHERNDLHLNQDYLPGAKKGLGITMLVHPPTIRMAGLITAAGLKTAYAAALNGISGAVSPLGSASGNQVKGLQACTPSDQHTAHMHPMQ